MADYVLIETPEQLDELVQKLARERVIAVDTEADSFYHYFDKLCLVQIGYRGGIALVDPVTLPKRGLRPLAPILADPGIRKIFHAADYDLYVLSRYGGFQVRNIFDTMASAQLLGYPAVGLAAIVERHFGVKMSKDPGLETGRRQGKRGDEGEAEREPRKRPQASSPPESSPPESMPPKSMPFGGVASGGTSSLGIL